MSFNISRKETSDVFHTCVVLGKCLLDDQVSVEYASRIRTLVLGLKTRSLKPNLICFTGGLSGSNNVPDAHAGYVFFRHMCKHQAVDLQKYSFHIDSTSKSSREAMLDIISFTRKFKEQAEEIARSRRTKKGMKLMRMQRNSMRDPVPFGLANNDLNYHFTIISCLYHLQTIDAVHLVSPRRSTLTPLIEFGASYEFEPAPYPYIDSTDKTTKYLAHTLLGVEQLVPLMMNLEGMSESREMLVKRNLKALDQVILFLIEQWSCLHDARSGLCVSNLRSKAEELQRSLISPSQFSMECLDDVLQRAICNLRTVEEALGYGRAPSILRTNVDEALSVLTKTIAELRSALDPDRPLLPREWGLLVTEDPGQYAQKRHRPIVQTRQDHFAPNSSQDNYDANQNFASLPLYSLWTRPMYTHPLGYWSTVYESTRASLYDEDEERRFTAEHTRKRAADNNHDAPPYVAISPAPSPLQPEHEISHLRMRVDVVSSPTITSSPDIHTQLPLATHIADGDADPKRTYDLRQNFDDRARVATRPPQKMQGAQMHLDGYLDREACDTPSPHMCSHTSPLKGSSHEEGAAGIGAVRAQPLQQVGSTGAKRVRTEKQVDSDPMSRLPQALEGPLHTHDHLKLSTLNGTPEVSSVVGQLQPLSVSVQEESTRTLKDVRKETAAGGQAHMQASRTDTQSDSQTKPKRGRKRGSSNRREAGP